MNLYDRMKQDMARRANLPMRLESEVAAEDLQPGDVYLPDRGSKKPNDLPLEVATIRIGKTVTLRGTWWSDPPWPQTIGGTALHIRRLRLGQAVRVKQRVTTPKGHPLTIGQYEALEAMTTQKQQDAYMARLEAEAGL